MSAPDPIPLEDVFEFASAPQGVCSARFFAFNTQVELVAYADEHKPGKLRAAFEQARERCRTFERLFSRTLPHSDIARLNGAGGAAIPIAPETYELLQEALGYCAKSEGAFDITMGAATRLWNFATETIPEKEALDEALSHVDWRMVRLWTEEAREKSRVATGAPDALNGASGPAVAHPLRHFARLDDPQAAIDAGGIAKGYIADRLTELLEEAGVHSFIVNLGGNVAARGRKPDGSPWRIGLQDPRTSGDGLRGIVGAIAITDASAVTSGIYERCFWHDGVRYHHILDPRDGMPARTDLAGATILARRSIDAEGYSTTVLALGKERGANLVRHAPAIIAAYLVSPDGAIETVPGAGLAPHA